MLYKDSEKTKEEQSSIYSGVELEEGYRGLGSENTVRQWQTGRMQKLGKKNQ